MRGRKPNPTRLKVITGSKYARKDADEPKPAVEVLEPPPELTEDARIEWDRLAPELYRIGLLTVADRGAFSAYCQAYGRWIKAERALNELATRDPLTHALIITTIKGNRIPNPLLGVANKLKNDMVRYAAEFGLTPSARSRIKAEAQLSANDPAAKYFTA